MPSRPQGTDVRNPFDRENRERGATLVEYSVAMALIVAVSVPAMGAATTAMSTGMNNSVSHFAHTNQNLNLSGGPAPTVPPTTTTTVPPTTTTTQATPDQTETRNVRWWVDGGRVNISVTFHETNGVVSVYSVDPGGWTYLIIQDQRDNRERICFFDPSSARELHVTGRIRDSDGELRSWGNRLWWPEDDNCP